MATAWRGHVNYPSGITTLASTISNSDTTIALATGTGANCIKTSNFTITFSSGEVVLVGTRTGDSLSGCTRGYNGSTATGHLAGESIEMRLIEKDIVDIETAINGIENGTTTLSSVTTSGAAIIGGNFTLTGKSIQSYTETGILDSRPVANAMTFKYTPSGTPGIAIDAHGLDILSWADSASVTDDVSLYPFESQAGYYGTGHLEGLVPAYFVAQNWDTGTVDEMWLARLWAKNLSTGVVTTIHGVHIENPVNSGGGTIGTIHAVDIENITTGATENFGVYSRAKNYMASLGVANAGANLNSYLEVGGSSGSANFNMYLKGSGTTSGTWAMVVHNSAGSAIMTLRNDRLTTIQQLTVSTDLAVDGNTTLGNASTDTITATGRLLVRSVTDAGPMTATPGTQREVVFNTSDSKYYGCTVTHVTAATWVAFN